MIIEYSQEVKGMHFAYRFDDDEKKIIIKAFQAEIKKLERKIERIKNHPKNEGQATFSMKIREVRLLIESYQDAIKGLS